MRTPQEGRALVLAPSGRDAGVAVSLLYSRARQLSPRVRVFLDWAAGEFAKQAGVTEPVG